MRRLRLDLDALAGALLVAEAGARDLGALAGEAPPGGRARLRPFVAERLPALLGAGRLAPAAMDALLRLAAEQTGDLGPAREAARRHGLADDEAAGARRVPGALRFLFGAR